MSDTVTTPAAPVDDPTPVRSTSSAPVRSSLSYGWIFGSAFIVGLVFESVLAVVLMATGITTGYNGKVSFESARLKQLIIDLFGGTDELLKLVGAAAILGALLWAIFALHSRGYNGWAICFGLALIAFSAISFQHLKVGTYLVPLVGFVLFVAAQAAIAALPIYRRSNY